MIHFACPSCKTALRADPEHTGVKITCPTCGQRLQVPAAARNKTLLGIALPTVTPPSSQGISSTRVPSATTPATDRGTMQWHYRHQGEQRGPVSFAHVHELASSGELARSDLIWTQGMGQWLPAGKVEGLFPQANRWDFSHLRLVGRRSWRRFRATPTVVQFLTASMAFLLLILAFVLMGHTILSGDQAQTTSPPIAGGTGEAAESRAAAEAEKLKLDVKTAEERAVAERSVTEKLKREVKAAEEAAEKLRADIATADSIVCTAAPVFRRRTIVRDAPANASAGSNSPCLVEMPTSIQIWASVTDRASIIRKTFQGVKVKGHTYQLARMTGEA